MIQIQNNKINCTKANEVLKQEYHLVLFHSHKINNYQLNYPITNKELLSIAGTLLEHKNILYSTKIYVYSDHKNLAYLNAAHTSTHTQRHRLILDEFRCAVTHFPCERDNIANLLSRFSMKDLNENKEIEEMYCLQKVHSKNIALPIRMPTVTKYQ